MSNKTHKISINLELNQAEMQELKKTTDNVVDKGIFDRDRYLITCEARDANNNVVSWHEKAYNSVFALAVGAVACQAKVGNPNCSAKKE